MVENTGIEFRVLARQQRLLDRDHFPAVIVAYRVRRGEELEAVFGPRWVGLRRDRGLVRELEINDPVEPHKFAQDWVGRYLF